MLFTELKKIQDDDIEQALEERLKARGLDPAILHQSLGGSDVTVEELISVVVDGLIAQAVDANRGASAPGSARGSSRHRPQASRSAARPASRRRPSRRSAGCTRHTRSAARRPPICWGSHAARFIGGSRRAQPRKTSKIEAGGGGKTAIYCVFRLFIPRKSSKNGGRIPASIF